VGLMAVEQPLKGGTNKVYSVINNFNKGIDKKSADDVSVDSSFRDLKNFYNSNEGILSKRPGVYNSNLRDFIKAILDNDYESTSFNIVANKFGEEKAVLIPRLQDFYDTILLGQQKEQTQGVDNITFKILIVSSSNISPSINKVSVYPLIEVNGVFNS
jgi:hypothetical protein